MNETLLNSGLEDEWLLCESTTWNLREVFRILLQQKGIITDNQYRRGRTVGVEVGKDLQNATSPYDEGAGLFMSLEEIRKDFLYRFYGTIGTFRQGLIEAGYGFEPGCPGSADTGWVQVCRDVIVSAGKMNPFVVDAILVNFLSKAVGRNLTGYFGQNLSFVLCTNTDLMGLLPTKIYDAYAKALNECDSTGNYLVNLDVRGTYASTSGSGLYFRDHVAKIEIGESIVPLNVSWVCLFKGWRNENTGELLSTSTKLYLRVQCNTTVTALWDITPTRGITDWIPAWAYDWMVPGVILLMMVVIVRAVRKPRAPPPPPP
jgi:hypothetical protein